MDQEYRPSRMEAYDQMEKDMKARESGVWQAVDAFGGAVPSFGANTTDGGVGIGAPRIAAAPRSPHQDVMLDLPIDAGDRKDIPVCTGVLDYFPAALAEIARLSKVGNDQHNPGEPLHWARGKSTDQPDTIVRHLMQRGTVDTDGIRHSTKVAWRALALLQEELERDAGFVPGGE